ncbi:unnamed protein product [Calypogeia fissa]
MPSGNSFEPDQSFPLSLAIGDPLDPQLSGPFIIWETRKPAPNRPGSESAIPPTPGLLPASQGRRFQLAAGCLGLATLNMKDLGSVAPVSSADGCPSSAAGSPPSVAWRNSPGKGTNILRGIWRMAW